jgi:hypothetical protein
MLPFIMSTKSRFIMESGRRPGITNGVRPPGFELNATPALVKTVQSFKIDRVKVFDDF